MCWMLNASHLKALDLFREPFGSIAADWLRARTQPNMSSWVSALKK